MTTSNNIPIGAIAYSRSGNGGIVTQVEAERVVVKCPDGLKRVPISAIARWELPLPAPQSVTEFHLGDSPKGTLLGETHAVGVGEASPKEIRSETCRQTGTSARFHPLRERVRYIGTDPNLQRQYAGVLEIWEISKYGDGYACLKTDGRVSSWIRFEDLDTLGSIRPLPPPLTTRQLRLGDSAKLRLGQRVEIVSTGEWGRLGQWDRGRTKAIVELDDGSRSDWVKVAALRYLEEG